MHNASDDLYLLNSARRTTVNTDGYAKFSMTTVRISLMHRTLNCEIDEATDFSVFRVEVGLCVRRFSQYPIAKP